MIRFLDLKGQITEDQESFGFYCTITDEILSFGGEQLFDSLDHFKFAYSLEKERKKDSIYNLQRLLGFIPNRITVNKEQ